MDNIVADVKLFSDKQILLVVKSNLYSTTLNGRIYIFLRL